MQQTGLRFLLPYMRPYRGLLVWGTLYAALGAGAAAFSPTLLGWAVDELQRGIRPQVLLGYSAGLVGLACTLAFFRYQLRMLTGTIAVGVSYRMGNDFFARLLELEQQALREFGTGDILSRATADFIYIWRFYSAGFQMTMFAMFLLLIGCSLMAFTNPLLAGLVVTMLLCSIAVQVGLGRMVERSFDAVQRRLGAMSSFTQEHISAARMLAAYGQERQVVVAFQRLNQAYADQYMGFVLRSGAITPLPALVVRIAATLVLAIGGVLIISNQLTVGEYVQFVVYLGLLSNAANQLSRALERLQQGSAAAGRIGEVLLRRPRIADRPGAISPNIQGHLRFQDVGLRAEGRWILRQINLDIPHGATVGIVGATGAGKSSLLSLIGRTRDPDEGSVVLDGHDVRDLKLAALRGAIGYVPQETLLFGMSLRDNMTFGLDDTPDEYVEVAMRTARLINDLPQLPQGLATTVGERGTTLSGGQKQRTAIARALVRDPQILILDDSMASVDMHTASEILTELKSARRDRTTIIISQRMASVRDADNIVVLDGGRIVEQGTHAELLQANGLYAAMYRRELREAEEQDEVMG